MQHICSRKDKAKKLNVVCDQMKHSALCLKSVKVLLLQLSFRFSDNTNFFMMSGS